MINFGNFRRRMRLAKPKKKKKLVRERLVKDPRIPPENPKESWDTEDPRDAFLIGMKKEKPARGKLKVKMKPNVRGGAPPLGWRHRQTSYSPGGSHRNMLFWPGFKKKKPIVPVIPLLKTPVKSFGRSLDTYPTYYESEDEKKPLESSDMYAYPGTDAVRFNPPPIEPGVIWDEMKKQQPKRRVVNVGTGQEVPSKALPTEEGLSYVTQDSIYMGDNAEPVTPEQVEKIVEAEKKKMTPEQAARVNWGVVANNIWRNLTQAYAAGLEAKIDPITGRVPSEEERAKKPTVLKGAVIGLGIAVLGTLAAIKLASL